MASGHVAYPYFFQNKGIEHKSIVSKKQNSCQISTPRVIRGPFFVLFQTPIIWVSILQTNKYYYGSPLEQEGGLNGPKDTFGNSWVWKSNLAGGKTGATRIKGQISESGSPSTPPWVGCRLIHVFSSYISSHGWDWANNCACAQHLEFWTQLWSTFYLKGLHSTSSSTKTDEP